MPALVDLLGSLRAGTRALAFAGWTASVVYGHRALASVAHDLRTPARKRPFIAAWCRGAVRALGVELHVVRGAAPDPDGGPYLVVANHRSPLDVLVCVHLVGGVVLSHAGVASLPVIGAAAKATDTIFVDRKDGRSGARAIREMRSRLREGRNVIVFPEGTTFRGDEVHAFKRGSFSAARRLDVKVVPIGVAYEPGCEYVGETFGGHLARMTKRRRTPIWVSIGEPRDVPDGVDGEEALRGALQLLVAEAAAARDRR